MTLFSLITSPLGWICNAGYPIKEFSQVNFDTVELRVSEKARFDSMISLGAFLNHGKGALRSQHEQT